MSIKYSKTVENNWMTVITECTIVLSKKRNHKQSLFKPRRPDIALMLQIMKSNHYTLSIHHGSKMINEIRRSVRNSAVSSILACLIFLFSQRPLRARVIYALRALSNQWPAFANGVMALYLCRIRLQQSQQQ